MSGPYFIEILSRNGEVRQRQRMDTLPISIGRAYDNDFILDDRHTSPHHAVIQSAADGGLEIHDLGSRNGVVCKGQRRALTALDGNTVFRLGHTRLRIRSMDFPVVDEIVDTTRHSWEGMPPAMAGFALLMLVTLASVWGTDTERSEPVRYFTVLAGVFSLGLLWSGAWALANRLFEGQMRFGRHLFIAACGLLASEAVSLLTGVTAYAFSLEVLTRYENYLEIAIVAGMVYFHLRTINPNHPRRFALIAAVVAMLGSGVMALVHYQTRGQLADELYMSELLPPSLRLSSDKPVSQFLNEVGKMKSSVDTERGREVGDGGDDADGQD